MAEQVLVTGGTGFVAGWTIVELLKRGYRVRVTVRNAKAETSCREAVARITDLDSRLSFAFADLMADDGWNNAAEGCDYVLHIASPLGTAGNDGETIIEAARGGTLRVLKAAVDAGAKKVVMTSSTAACTPANAEARVIDERDWTDPDQQGLSVYRRSKVLSERAAWSFMSGKSTKLITILPGAIFGPVLRRDQQGSVNIIRLLLAGRPPFLPRLAFNITDVRDLAELHVRAMVSSEADGERFIAMGEALWFREVADALKDGLAEGANRVPARDMPDVVARLLANFSPQMKALLPLLGRTQKFGREKAQRVLKFLPRPPWKTVVDCGGSLLS
jgi:nucleoside-diphosphate-sugar epimerase